MQLLTLATLLVAGSATAFAGAVEKRANLKVNEFTSAFIQTPLECLCHI